MAAAKKPAGKKPASKPPTGGAAKVDKAASVDSLNKKDIKFALQARAEASKRGTPSGATNAGSYKQRTGSDRMQTAQTIITSKRGNTYSIDKDKEQRRFRPDKTKTTISQIRTKAAPKKK